MVTGRSVIRGHSGQSFSKPPTPLWVVDTIVNNQCTSIALIMMFFHTPQVGLLVMCLGYIALLYIIITRCFAAGGGCNSLPDVSRGEVLTH